MNVLPLNNVLTWIQIQQPRNSEFTCCFLYLPWVQQCLSPYFLKVDYCVCSGLKNCYNCSIASNIFLTMKEIICLRVTPGCAWLLGPQTPPESEMSVDSLMHLPNDGTYSPDPTNSQTKVERTQLQQHSSTFLAHRRNIKKQQGFLCSFPPLTIQFSGWLHLVY
jgi:hypothetical protein